MDTTRLYWKDGARWDADDASFAAALRQLDAARDVIVGLDPIADRLASAAAAPPALIDAVARDEGERAILTAAVQRCEEDARGLSAADLGLPDDASVGRYLRALHALRELVQTDVTW